MSDRPPSLGRRLLGSLRGRAPAPPAPPADDPSLLLVARIQSGLDHEESSRLLFERHQRSVHAFFSRRGFGSEECRDLTQDVFLRVFKSIGSFRKESRFERWLFEVAAHVYHNELRRRSASKREGFEDSLEDAMERDPALGAGRGGEGFVLEPDALAGLLERERLDALRAALKEMPHQMRTCFLLRYARGHKYREIAVLMKISVETVKAHLYQARSRLKLRLGDGDDG
jgi:RNA polymerase sigma-70 factor, ECF subfamily